MKSNTPHSRSGWDGKLRVNKQATLANPEALSDPEYSDEDAPPPEKIEADEGEEHRCTAFQVILTIADLLEGEDPEAEAGITSKQQFRHRTNRGLAGDRLSTLSRLLNTSSAPGTLQATETVNPAAEQHPAYPATIHLHLDSRRAGAL
jgi:hypothetical protein